MNTRRERRRRIVVLNQFALPRSQAGGTRHVELFGRLEGWEAIVVAGNRNHASQEEFKSDETSLVTIRVPKNTGGGFSRLASWVSYCLGATRYSFANGRFDVVYGSTPHLLSPLVGLVIARLTGAAFVLEVRDLWPESFVSAGLVRRGSLTYRAFRGIEKIVSRNADRIVVVTDGWADHFKDLGVSETKLTVIPNGAELRDDVGVDDLGGLRARGYRSIGIFAGSHGPKDGIAEILSAARSRPEVGVVLMGDGPVKDEAREQASDLENVVFLDPVPKSRLGALLAGADFGIHSVTGLDVFEKGMSPNKIFDYMSAELPIVSNAGRGVLRLLNGRDVGYVGGPGSLAEGFDAIVGSSQTEKKRYGSAARGLLESFYSRGASAETLRTVLDGVVAERRSR